MSRISNTLVYSCWAISSKNGSQLMHRNLAFLDDFTFMSYNTTDVGLKCIRSVIPDANITYDSSIIEQFYAMENSIKTWKEFYDNLDISKFSGVKNLFLNGSILWQSARRDSKRLLPADEHISHYVSHDKPIACLLGFLKIANVYNLHIDYIAYDPQEYPPENASEWSKPTSISKYYWYRIPSLGLDGIDTLQSYYQRYGNLLKMVKCDKMYDFVSGYRNVEIKVKRIFNESLIDFILGHFEKCKFFVEDKWKDIHTFVPMTEYTEYIKRSRFTYIFPGYDNTCFTLSRMLEALFFDCLPIIDKNCNIKDVNESFGIDFGKLMFTENDLTEMTEEKRMQYVNEFKNALLSVRFLPELK